jgi:hypothetical protein
MYFLLWKRGICEWLSITEACPRLSRANSDTPGAVTLEKGDLRSEDAGGTPGKINKYSRHDVDGKGEDGYL